ncbi:hypothetical protein TNCV_2682671 [Trichonephila clavipes]|nr:hypothetical protein TNCV_2682671 [Trichonephila clavipes]
MYMTAFDVSALVPQMLCRGQVQGAGWPWKKAPQGTSFWDTGKHSNGCNRPAEGYSNIRVPPCYEEWKKRLQHCVASEGSYFEGDNVELQVYWNK